MLDKNFIIRKINLIQEELKYLIPIKNITFNEIFQDPIKQAAVERFLERVINRAIDVNQHIIAETSKKDVDPPLTYKETFTRLADVGIYPKEFAENISKSVGLRNILLHEYDKTDLEKLYSSINHCLQDYNKYCQYILDFID